MKKECSIVRDLLPLYAENMVSQDTAAFVAEHLKGCEDCGKAYEQLQKPHPVPPSDDEEPLRTLSRKLKRKRLQTMALTAIFVVALLVSAFAVLDAPVYFPYAHGVVTVETYGDAGVLLRFGKGVTDFRCTVHQDPDYSGQSICDVEAWTTLWDQWLSRGNKNLSATVEGVNQPMLIFYVSNDCSENICLARFDPHAAEPLQMDGETKGVTTLPRLALGYYLILAAVALAVMAVLWLVTRKIPNVRIWVERVGLYPAAYLISHGIVSGVNWETYSISRDFSLVVFLSILLYSGLLLAHNIWYLTREIQSIDR